MAPKETIDDRKAMMAKTSRLRELRLAKEAEDRKAIEALPAKKVSAKTAATKKAPKARTPAPWPW